MSDNYLNIGEVAEILNVSIDTLRRWDESKKLITERTEGDQRIYKLDSLKNISADNIFINAKLWAIGLSKQLEEKFYCSSKDIFQARHCAMERLLARKIGDVYSIISSSVGEIGNNAFDHNLGKWPDIPGLYFNYNFDTRQIVLADRGLGILKTLQYVLPGLTATKDALDIAFTEVITGRAPEKRGNGLKYVRRNIERGYFSLTFQTGNMELKLKSGEVFNITNIQQTKISIPGCLVLVEF